MGKGTKLSKQPLLEEEDEQIQQDKEDHLPVDNTLTVDYSNDLCTTVPETQPQYICKVNGPGVESATANHPSHVLVELKDMVTGRPCTQSKIVTAELHSELIKEEKHHGLFKRRHQTRISVDQKTTATYRVCFTAANRGKLQLHIKIDGVEIKGSPCDITVYPDPNQLKKPINEIPNLNCVWDATVNSRGQIIASDFSRNEVVTLDSEGEIISIYDCRGPTGVTVDDEDNVYVSCAGQVKMFSHDGNLLMSVGKSGQKTGEFIRPEGLKCYKGHLYVCDTLNNRIQVFQTDTLEYVKTIGCQGCGNIEFNHPWAIDFDSAGRAYVADQNNSRIQVIDIHRGGFLKEIGLSGRGKLNRPTTVRILGEFMYVSDDDNCRVSVFHTATGDFVTSFGGHSDPNGKKYRGPFRICTVDRNQDRFIYVFDLTSAHIF